MKRAIVLVLDGCGAGAAPDAAAFGDPHHPNTLENVWQHNAGIDAPLLGSLGYFGPNHLGPAPSNLDIEFGRLQPLSQGGKDSVTGHWEMMGILVEDRFPTYPNGFPADLMAEFERRIGRKTLGNKPASGTTIIAELGEEHLRTGSPIVYTSADSVFQIAVHEDIIPIEQLYEFCRIARELGVRPNHYQRVIARPFEGEPGAFRRTERRKDFPMEPPSNLIDEVGDVFGIGVVPELFGGRGFRPLRRTQSNPEHEAMLLGDALSSDARFIFANFEDFDMLYGHRSDPTGFAKCLEAFDLTLAKILERLTDEDLLILTADHGNDPTDVSTDHTREYVPYVALRKGTGARTHLEDRAGFARVGEAVAEHLAIPWTPR